MGVLYTPDHGPNWAPPPRLPQLGRTSLGSLIYITLLRTVGGNNFSQMRDLYLPTNALAALANMAPHMSGIHRCGTACLLGACMRCLLVSCYV